LNVATERQIEANRRNAKKSTGPQSAGGKKRCGQNAHRHGLSKPISSVDFERQLEFLARQIAGEALDARTVELARVAAEADLELARIRHFKVAMIERVVADGSVGSFRHSGRGCIKPPWPIPTDPLATMPREEPYRSAEATRRLLPEFVKLLRYEERAAGRRNRAIRKLRENAKG
jgi:hypothetical protein